MDKKTLAALLESGAQGTNPFVEQDNNEKLLKLKDMLAGQRSDKNLQMASNYIDENARRGRKVSVALNPEGGTTISQAETDPAAKNAAQSRQEVSSLDKLYKTHLKPAEEQMDAANTIHTLLDNPNALNDKNIQVKLARMYEGSGQRLLQTVIQNAGGKPDLIRNGSDAVNFLLGSAKTGLSQDKMNAIREEALSNGKIAQDNYAAGLDRFNNAAQAGAPTLRSNGQLDGLVTSYSARGNTLSKGLNDRDSQYKAASNGKTGYTQGQPDAYQPGTVDKLKSLFGMGGSSAPQPQQKATGGFNPDSYLKGN